MVDDPVGLLGQLVLRVGGVTDHDTCGRAQLIDQIPDWPRKRSLPEQDYRGRVVLQRKAGEAAVFRVVDQELDAIGRFDQWLLGSLVWCEHRFDLGWIEDASLSVRLWLGQIWQWPLVAHVANPIASA